jgi:hypothetical protein
MFFEWLQAAYPVPDASRHRTAGAGDDTLRQCAYLTHRASTNLAIIAAL